MGGGQHLPKLSGKTPSTGLSGGLRDKSLLFTSGCVATHPKPQQRSGTVVEKPIKSAGDGQR